MAKENVSVQQPSYGLHSQLTFMNVFHKFMYSAFEQALSMKRALYKFGIIIILV